jgi:catechol 2,3-dioxygenase-like lactoylglutathione lyase family enzyme
MLALADFAVTVTNARTSADWWTRKLGFDVHTIDGPKGHAVLVAPPGERFLLHLCEGFEPVEAGNTGIAFVTDDLENLVRRMDDDGVVFTEPLRVGRGGGSAKFADPDGNVFWLVGAPRQFIRTQTALRARERGSARPRNPRARGTKRARRR